MGLMDAAKSAVNSITGNSETAYLVIKDYRAAARAAESAGAAAAASAIQDMTSQTANRAGGMSLSSRTQNAIQAKAASLGESAKRQAMQNLQHEEKIFRVQFNPSEVQLYCANFPSDQSNALGSGPQSISNAVNKPNLEMTIQLHFDDMNISDSFMWDKFTSGASAQTITNAATAVGKLMGKVWSVQPQVEGLVSALRNPYTREVSFHWADFAFHGQVTAIMAQYTMFSTSGRPVRAKVVLRLRHEMDPDKLAGWYADFDKAFGNEANVLKKAGQAAGNLLNIGL